MIRVFRIVAGVLSVLTVIVLLRSAISEYLAPSGKNVSHQNLLLAAKITGENASYSFRLGSRAYSLHDDENLSAAMRYFRAAVDRYPAYGPAWLGLAGTYNDLGYSGLAETSVAKSAFFDKSNRRAQWEAGMYFVLAGKAEQAAPFFRRYISMVPPERGTVYTMFYTLGFSPEFIRTRLVDTDYSSYRGYLDFLMANKRPDEASDIWKHMSRWKRSRDDYLSYLDFLINAGRIEDAASLWDEYAKNYGLINGRESSSELIWNGGFELPVQNGGFDWKFGSAEGFRVFLDSDVKRSGYVSLSAQFFGTANPDVYLAYQIVPLSSSRHYLLKGKIQTDGLTTTNGVFLEVSGQSCEPFSVKSPTVQGSSLWQDVELDFTVPPVCKSVKVGIKREKSEKFDNKISGDVWIDSISMTAARKSPSEKP